MALSYEEFMSASGADLVAGNIIIGVMADRKKLGSLSDEGVFNLNEEGLALATELEAAAAGKPARRKKADSVDATAEAAAEIASA